MAKDAELAKVTADAAAEALGQLQAEAGEEEQIRVVFSDDPEFVAEQKAQSETPPEPKPETPSSEGEQAEVAVEKPPATPEARKGTEAQPDRYFDVDLSSLTAEERAEVIGGLKERDDLIGKLLRENAELKKGETPAAQSTPEPTPEEALTEDDILKALGLDPEDPFDAKAAKLAMVLVPQVQELRTAVSRLVDTQETEVLEASWRNAYMALSSQHGDLPVTFEGFIEFAAGNGIANPEDAYWRIAGPASRQLRELVDAKLAERVAAKKAATTLRPEGGSNTEESSIEGKNVKEVAGKAARKILEDLGIA